MLLMESAYTKLSPGCLLTNCHQDRSSASLMPQSSLPPKVFCRYHRFRRILTAKEEYRQSLGTSESWDRGRMTAEAGGVLEEQGRFRVLHSTAALAICRQATGSRTRSPIRQHRRRHTAQLFRREGGRCPCRDQRRSAADLRPSPFGLQLYGLQISHR